MLRKYYLIYITIIFLKTYSTGNLVSKIEDYINTIESIISKIISKQNYNRKCLERIDQKIKIIINGKSFNLSDLQNPTACESTALHWAVCNSSPAFFEALLESNLFDINKRDELGRTPFDIAIMLQNFGIAKTLAKKGANTDSFISSMYLSIKYNDMIYFNNLVNSGLNFDYNTIIKYALKFNNKKALNILNNKGLNFSNLTNFNRFN